MNRLTETNWLQKEHASSLHDGGPLSLFHVTYAWGKLGTYSATLTKGSHVQIEGEIRTRDYSVNAGNNQADVKKSITEVHVTAINNLDRAQNPDASQTPEAAA